MGHGFVQCARDRDLTSPVGVATNRIACTGHHICRYGCDRPDAGGQFHAPVLDEACDERRLAAAETASYRYHELISQHWRIFEYPNLNFEFPRLGKGLCRISSLQIQFAKVADKASFQPL